MSRTARIAAGGIYFHVLNRGNNRARVFHGDDEYCEFLRLMAKARERVPVQILAYCLMPNHFHLVLYPLGDKDLGRWMHWLLTTHGQRHARRHRRCGHLWQNRFRSFPIQDDGHLLRVMRYVERNPVRAGLVRRAEDWPWSSLRSRLSGTSGLQVTPPPIDLPSDWVQEINYDSLPPEVEVVRKSIRGGHPYGEREWWLGIAARLGLSADPRPPGRPRKQK